METEYTEYIRLRTLTRDVDSVLWSIGALPLTVSESHTVKYCIKYATSGTVIYRTVSVSHSLLYFDFTLVILVCGLDGRRCQ